MKLKNLVKIVAGAVFGLGLLMVANVDANAQGNSGWAHEKNRIRKQQKQIEKAGGKFFFDLGDPDDDDFERKFRDPNGIIFDINWKGWTMTSGKVKSAAARKNVGKKTKKLTKTGKKARKR